jgi:DNA polymerase sigma
MVRPLVLVLKQFLLDRGLLTAYTGGLSSYCLFLMVARYCQEQVPIWNDCGSLLMGYVFGEFGANWQILIQSHDLDFANLTLILAVFLISTEIVSTLAPLA